MAQLKNTTINDTGFLQLPSGTTGERPQSPAAGEIRFNTDTKVTEWYDDQLDAWFPTGVVPPVATGGDTVEDVDIDGVTYRIHSFTTVGESTFTVTRGGPVEYLIVAGGGGGGGFDGAGGGSGGLLVGSTSVSTNTYNVGIGQGGSPGGNTYNQPGNNGANSYFFGQVAVGGGGGGSTAVQGKSGGSGGGGGGDGPREGAGPFVDGGLSVPGQGNPGGTGVDLGNGRAAGGGGGAGEVGSTAGNAGEAGDGGNGIALPITGVIKFYAGGGGGSGDSINGIGGLGGGGDRGEDGEPNTGGGGGRQSSGFGSGGSGIVIIRYRIS